MPRGPSESLGPVMPKRRHYDTRSDRAHQKQFCGDFGEPRALAGRFYTELFAAAPQLRGRCSPRSHVSAGTFEAAFALVIRNLEEMRTLEQPLRELGAQHVRWGAKPKTMCWSAKR